MAISADALRRAAFEAERALDAFNASLMEYQEAVRRRDWAHADNLHGKVTDNCGSYLDAIAAGQKLLEAGGKS